MEIREVEQRTGLERANIRFYEREKLIRPERAANGYRDYSEDDIQLLLRIKLLRSLHLSLEDIRALASGRRELDATLENQLQVLQREAQGIDYARQLCSIIQADRVSFDQLDADKYLSRINQPTESVGRDYALNQDRLPQVHHPWRRYLARMLDLSLYQLPWFVVLALVFQVNLTTRTTAGSLLDLLVATLLMLMLEPLLLHLFGTTPGKAVFGLYLEADTGGRLSYSDALGRTALVLSRGLGFNIPIYNLVRLWKSYRQCEEEQPQPWDEGCSYTIRDTHHWRSAVYLAAIALLITLNIGLISYQELPPHRGELTVAEFADNYNYYARYLDIDYRLDSAGNWVDEADNLQPGQFIFSIGTPIVPQFSYTLVEDALVGVRFTAESGSAEGWLTAPMTEQELAALALAGSGEEMGLFKFRARHFARQIVESGLNGYSFDYSGFLFSSTCTYSGYNVIESEGLLIPQEEVDSHFFELEFVAEKLGK